MLLKDHLQPWPVATIHSEQSDLQETVPLTVQEFYGPLETAQRSDLGKPEPVAREGLQAIGWRLVVRRLSNRQSQVLRRP